MLTLKEQDRIEGINIKNHYGITDSMLKTLITRHKKARANNDNHEMELIEYRLTDINFHSECGLLSKGKYDEAYKMLED